MEKFKASSLHLKNVKHESAEMFFSKFSKNILTPEVINYFDTEDFLIELSKGKSINSGRYFYGVTVHERKSKKLYNLQPLFTSKEEAFYYINKIAKN